MGETLGAVVGILGVAMLGVAYIWFVLAVVGWAVEVIREPPRRKSQRLILFVLVLLFFPIGLLLLPFILNRMPPEEEPVETAFPI